MNDICNDIFSFLAQSNVINNNIVNTNVLHASKAKENLDILYSFADV
jgi:hypothetical protein